MFNSIFVAVATICATTTAASTPLFWRDGGRSNQQQQQRRAGKYKNSKKQNVQQCTLDQFTGDYKYVNCEGVETKVGITCANANGMNQCNYKEKPMEDDKGDDVCVVQGSFDATDATYIMMDPARPGVCQLKFVALKDSCQADAVPAGFGMKAEVDMTAGPDDETSTMVLWFSTNGGLVYYNAGEPQDTVFLYQDLPRGRKLEEGCDVDVDATFFWL